jgi:hypothetical protein
LSTVIWRGHTSKAKPYGWIAEIASNKPSSTLRARFGPRRLVHWYDPTGPAPACRVLQVDCMTYLAHGIGDHPPSQIGYLLAKLAVIKRFADRGHVDRMLPSSTVTSDQM